jgi:TP901 family phage tail tape measure protein
MPVYLDVKSRLDTAAAMLAAREAKAIFSRAGDDIGGGLGKSLSKALSAIDGSSARTALKGLQAEYRATAAAEEAAALRMTRSMGAVEVAQLRLMDLTKGVADVSVAGSARMVKAENDLVYAKALSAKATRDHVDAMVAAEGAHKNLNATTASGAIAAGRAAQVWNGVGVASVAAVGAAMLETTRKAGDFQQQMVKLHAAAGMPVQDLKTASDGILKLAPKVGYSAGELSDALFKIGKYGYSAADGLKILDAAAQGANAEQIPLGETVNALTLSMHNFHAPAAEANRVMSQMITAAGQSRAPLGEFAGSLDTIEPIAAQLGLSLGDVWGTLSQITRSGTSADQATEWMRNAARAFSGAQAPARQAMQQFGIDADEVSQHLGGPNGRGLAGTAQYLYDTLSKKIDPSTGLLNSGDMLQSARAMNDADKMMAKMSPHARELAEGLKNNTIHSKEYTKAAWASNEQDKVQLRQFQGLIDKVDGFSKRLTGGRQTVETLTQALNEVTGTMSGAQVVLSITGDKAGDTNRAIDAINKTTAEADGTVKGFNESQDTLNAKMRDAKAAFGAAAIEMGRVFIPAATKVANVAKWIGDEMARHPGIMDGVIDVLGTLGGAWLGIKAIDVVGKILGPATVALGGLMGAEDAAAAGARGLGTALRGLIPYVAVAKELIDLTNKLTHDFSNVDPTKNPNGWWGTAFGVLSGPMKAIFGREAGGPLYAPGPKGKDSALFWGAAGEHVWTDDEVDATGGHAGQYALRGMARAGMLKNIRGYADGGAIGPDVYAAHSMAGTKYSQGNRNDCSGMVGRVVGSALGIPNAGLPTTQNMGQWLASLGFRPGTGGPGTISVGWYNHGPNPNDGHAAMTLSDGENAEAGGSHGDFRVGAGAAGANSPQFDQRMYLPNLYGQGAASGGGGGGFGGLGGFGGGGSPQKVAAAQEQVRHLDAEIANAEQRKSELKDDAKQSQKDRLDEEIRHLHAERDQAQDRLTKAQQGSALGGLGGLQFGAPLSEGFGLSGGVKGVGEWITTFLANLAIGPIEGAMLGNAIRAGQLGAGLGGAPGGYADIGDYGTPLPQTGVGAGVDAARLAAGLGDVGGSGTGTGESAGEIGDDETPPAASGAASMPPAAQAPAPGRPAPPAPVPTLLPPIGGIPGLSYTAGAPTSGHVPPPVRLGGAAGPADGGFGDFVARHPELQGRMLPPAPRPKTGAPNPGLGSLLGVPGHSSGALITGPGARGQDSVLSMVAPGEFVEQTQAVDKYGPGFMSALNQGVIDPRSLPHFDVGGMPPQNPPAPAAPQPHAGSGKAPGPPGAAASQAAAKGAMPPSEVSPDDRSAQTPAGVSKPGASARLADEGLPASSGIGFGGGVISAAEGAAAGAGGMGMPGASAGIQAGFQMLNRTAGYVGQLGGIALEGVLGTLLPSDSPLSQWGNTLPGKLLTGIAGVRPSAPNTAGQTQQPLEPAGGDTTNGDSIGSQFINHGPITVQANNPQDFHQQLMRDLTLQNNTATRQNPNAYNVPR